ncbi:MAG: phosphonate ABC transporter, permease protein PhnE [bacterium]|nr:phosphonate ABC transporter, permease protein PhnE [bacterium]
MSLHGLLVAWNTIRSFFPPDLSPSYLSYVWLPVVQTIGMASAGMVIALCLGIPLAIFVGTRAPGWRVVVTLLSALRAIPDLTLAILAVVIVGLGPPAGMAALAAFYTAMVGKVFAELFLAAPPAPLGSLRATGASRLSVALFGLIPLTLPDLLTFGAYSFECALRASVIVGAVGGGGIGTELVGAINGLDYPRATTLIVVLALLVAAIDTAGWFMRKHPRIALVLFPIGIATMILNPPQIFVVRHALVTFAAMFPPLLPAQSLARLPALIWQTLEIALGGTALAVAVAIPLALGSARNVVHAGLVAVLRRFLDVARAVPEIVWGLILVVTAGIGPLAGALALGIHSAGVLGKLFAEAFENVDRAPVEALAATGAGRLPMVAFGIIPLAMGPLAIHTMFRLEWNVRAATVVGMIGAGGIGEALYNAQQHMQYQQMMAYVAVTWLLVILADAVGERVRNRLGWKYVTE